MEKVKMIVREQVINLADIYNQEQSANRARQVLSKYNDFEDLVEKALDNKPEMENEIIHIRNLYNKLEELSDLNFELFKKGVHSPEQSRANAMKNKYNQNILTIVLSDYAERIDFKIL